MALSVSVTWLSHIQQINDRAGPELAFRLQE